MVILLCVVVVTTTRNLATRTAILSFGSRRRAAAEVRRLYSCRGKSPSSRDTHHRRIIVHHLSVRSTARRSDRSTSRRPRCARSRTCSATKRPCARCGRRSPRCPPRGAAAAALRSRASFRGTRWTCRSCCGGASLAALALPRRCLSWFVASVKTGIRSRAVVLPRRAGSGGATPTAGQGCGGTRIRLTCAARGCDRAMPWRRSTHFRHVSSLRDEASGATAEGRCGPAR